MRKIAVATLFLAGLAGPAAAEYSETRELAVDAGGAGLLELVTGAGSLIVEGVKGLDAVEVDATIVVDVMRDSKGREMIEKHAVLELDRKGDTIRLVAEFDNGVWTWGSNGRIDVVVRAPASLELSVDDGSGSLRVGSFDANVKIEDGSGSIVVDSVGALDLDDGSGSIKVRNAAGDVYINDGSGSITIDTVDGTVTIDDGSGGIDVSDVSEDLVIVDDGSGGVSFSDVRGKVKQEG
ncbi:MAG: hypothetical protein QNJ11_05060 [Woeseiaceae bacterium]|nr:hypothetical protein [Woeseiaceae bacterium]